jgi:putative ABC transport system permease protein
MNDLTIVLRSLRVRLFSTVTTALTVALAVAIVIVLLSVRGSGERALSRGAGNMHLLASAEASPLAAVLNSVFHANAPRQSLAWSQYDSLRDKAPWEYAIPTAMGDTFRGFPVVATTPEIVGKFSALPDRAWTLREGRVFDSDFEAVIGSAVARATGLRTGDTIAFSHGFTRSGAAVAGDIVKAGHESHGHDDHAHDDHDHDHDHDESGEGDKPSMSGHLHREFGCKVVGILEPSGTPHDRAVFCSLATSWIMHAHDRRERADKSITTTTRDDLMEEDRRITGVYLRLTSRDPRTAPANLPQVFEMLRRDAQLTVANPAREVTKLLEVIDATNKIVLAVGGAVMLSSIVGIMLALVSSMEQRRRQIGVMRVLGASRGRVLSMILAESALLGLMGAALGVVVAMVGMSIAAGQLRAKLGLVIESALSPTMVLYVVATTVLLACMAGLVPALMGYRTSVLRSLRPTA